MVSERRLPVMAFRGEPENSPVERASASLAGAFAAVSAFVAYLTNSPEPAGKPMESFK